MLGRLWFQSARSAYCRYFFQVSGEPRRGNKCARMRTKITTRNLYDLLQEHHSFVLGSFITFCTAAVGKHEQFQTVMKCSGIEAISVLA